MKNIQTKFETIIYGYQPSEFMPIYQGGELINRNQFIVYKFKKLGKQCVDNVFTRMVG